MTTRPQWVRTAILVAFAVAPGSGFAGGQAPKAGAKYVYTCSRCGHTLTGDFAADTLPFPKCGARFEYIVDRQTGEKKKTQLAKRDEKIERVVLFFVGVLFAILLAALALVSGLLLLVSRLLRGRKHERRSRDSSRAGRRN
jgi:hypothetical protein